MLREKDLFSKMKNPIASVALLCLCSLNFLIANAQFGVNGPKRGTEMYCFNNKLTDEDYKKLKKCKVYIVCPKSIVDNKEEIQPLFDEAWNYTDIEIIGDDEIKDYIDKKNVAFFTTTILSDGAIKEIYTELWTTKEASKRSSSDNKIQFARFDYYYLCDFQEFYKSNNSDQMFGYLSTEADIKNFKPGIVANYLKLIESYLKDKEFLDCHDQITNKEELSNLKDDTLYIADNLKVKFLFTAFKRGCESEDEVDVDKIMARYPYTYQLITFEELSEKIVNGDNFYYAICLKSDEMRKHLTVFKSSTGECIYNRKDMDSDFKSKDFKELADNIGK